MRWKNSDTSNEINDPLGVGRSAPDGYVYSIPEYSNKTSDLTSDEFHPHVMLAEMYHQASFENLKSGLDNMMKRKQRHNKSKTPITNVKDSLPTFFEVYETLEKIHSNTPDGYNVELTANLGRLISSAETQSQNIFQQVLSSKEKADQIRDALQVMHRFKSLFALPSSIEKNEKLGNYEQIIQDYQRAKTLFKDTKTPAFLKIIKNVEERMTRLEQGLRQKLLETNDELKITGAEQEVLLGHLLKLIVLRETSSEIRKKSLFTNFF